MEDSEDCCLLLLLLSAPPLTILFPHLCFLSKYFICHEQKQKCKKKYVRIKIGFNKWKVIAHNEFQMIESSNERDGRGIMRE